MYCKSCTKLLKSISRNVTDLLTTRLHASRRVYAIGVLVIDMSDEVPLCVIVAITCSYVQYNFFYLSSD